MKLVLALLAASLYILTQSSVVERKIIACKSSAIQCGHRCQGMCRSPFQLSAFNTRQPKKSRNKNKSEKKPTKKPKRTPKRKPTKKRRRKNRSVLDKLKRPSEINTRIKRGKKPIVKKAPKKKPPPKKTPLGSTLYRTLRPGENPANGITAKNPSAQKSIQSHVGCGCRPGYQSQYISTTKEYSVAVHYGGQNTIVAIDVGKARRAGCRIDDISDGSGLKNPAYNFARASKEVLISGCTIPADAVTVMRQAF